jgi:excisionase family DNA binding protein
MDKPDMSEYVLTVAEVAHQLGVTPSRVRQLIGEGRITGGIMRAGAWFFKADAAQTYVRKGKGGRPKKQ